MTTLKSGDPILESNPFLQKIPVTASKIEQTYMLTHKIIALQELLNSVLTYQSKLFFTNQFVDLTLEARLAISQWITSTQISIDTIQMLLQEAKRALTHVQALISSV